MQRQRAPSAASLHYGFARLELQLAAHVVHLGELSFFERRRGSRKIGASIDEVGVQPALVKVRPQIVMMVNVVAGALRGVGVKMLHATRPDTAARAANRRPRP